jgi:hypothetical protein
VSSTYPSHEAVAEIPEELLNRDLTIVGKGPYAHSLGGPQLRSEPVSDLLSVDVQLSDVSRDDVNLGGHRIATRGVMCVGEIYGRAHHR